MEKKVDSIQLNRDQVQRLKTITEQTFKVSNGDIEFAEKILARNDITPLEKILCGCYIRNFLIYIPEYKIWDKEDDTI